MNYTDLLSTPDTTNNREPNFPGFPDTGSQDSDRYIDAGHAALDARRRTWSTSSRSAAAAARRCSRPRSAPASSAARRSPIRAGSSSTSTATSLGITNAALDRRLPGARGVDQDRREHAELAARARTTSRPAVAFTQADVWLENQQYVPTITFGVDANDPANGDVHARRTSRARRPRS